MRLPQFPFERSLTERPPVHDTISPSHPRNHQRLPSVKRLQSATGLSVLALTAALALAACGKKDEGAAGPGGPGGPQGPLPVTVVEAQTRRIPITVESPGQSEGSKEVQVRARVGGILVKQRYAEGDRVKEGAVLFEIDPVPYEIALAQSKASRDQQKATLDQAVREEDRLKPLAAEQAIAGRDYDNQVTTRQTSQALLAARDADVRNAQLNLSYTKVTAPISGLSGRAQSSIGNLITVGTDSALLTTVSQTDPIWVRFSISESEYATLRANNDQSAKVELIQADGKLYPNVGKLNFAASTVDRTLGTVQLRAEVPNPDLRVLPGQFVKTRVYIGEVDGVLVPQVAVLTNDKGKAVMVVGPDNKVTPRPVETGTWKGDQWVITKGLQNGDKVIVDNLVKLRPGMQVAPHAPGQGPGQQPAGPDGAPTEGKAPPAQGKSDASPK
jgi:membrane fusion protein (multidrug efflux system)